jgi:hypothetical protein
MTSAPMQLHYPATSCHEVKHRRRRRRLFGEDADTGCVLWLLQTGQEGAAALHFAPQLQGAQGDSVSSWSNSSVGMNYYVHPALPPSLHLHKHTGVIYGRPTAFSAPRKYRVSAVCRGGGSGGTSSSSSSSGSGSSSSSSSVTPGHVCREPIIVQTTIQLAVGHTIPAIRKVETAILSGLRLPKACECSSRFAHIPFWEGIEGTEGAQTAEGLGRYCRRWGMMKRPWCFVSVSVLYSACGESYTVLVVRAIQCLW